MAIEIIVVGLGARGREWVREIKAAPAYQLVAGVDIDQKTLTRAATDLNIPRERCFAGLQEAIDKTNCQAAIVATPADCHGAACETAIGHRLAVLVEKPFTLSLAEAVKLVSLAERQSVPLLVAQNYRYLRSFRAAKELIGEGKLGPVGIVVSQYYRPRHDMAASLAQLQHSVLWGMGVHHLDALRFVLNEEVTNVAAESFGLSGSNLPDGSSFRAMLSFDGGTRALYCATYESSGHQFFERGQEFYLRFVGERATLHVFQRWLVLCESGRGARGGRRGAR